MLRFTGQKSGMRCNHCFRNWAFLSQTIFGFVLAKTFLVIIRSANLSYFWDPNAVWTVPIRCRYSSYNNVISATEMITSPEGGGGLERIKCSSCFTVFNHSPKGTQGDPHNIAYCGSYQ